MSHSIGRSVGRANNHFLLNSIVRDKAECVLGHIHSQIFESLHEEGLLLILCLLDCNCCLSLIVMSCDVHMMSRDVHMMPCDVT